MEDENLNTNFKIEHVRSELSINENVISFQTPPLSKYIELQNLYHNSDSENVFSQFVDSTDNTEKEMIENEAQSLFVDLDIKKEYDYSNCFSEFDEENNKANFAAFPLSIKAENPYHVSTTTNNECDKIRNINFEENQKNRASIARNKKRNIKRQKTTILCKYCNTKVLNFVRHCLRHHPNEKEVSEFLKFPVKSKERKRVITHLRNQIEFNEYITTKTYYSESDNPKYPCVYCKKLLSKPYLIRHSRSCGQQKHSGKRLATTSASQTILAMALNTNNALSELNVIEKVFPIMRADHISWTAKTDPLIMLVGESSLQKHANRRTTCSKMRDLARLLLGVRKTLQNKYLSLFHIMDVNLLGVVLNSAKNNALKAATASERIYATLNRATDVCVRMLSTGCSSFQCDNVELKIKEIKEFKKAIVLHWRTEPGNLPAENDRSVAEKPLTHVSVLTLTSYVKKFHEYVTEKAEKSLEILRNDNKNVEAYKNLAECALALTILYNRKQIREVQSMKLEVYLYNCAPLGLDELSTPFADTETILTSRCKKVVIAGHRTVIILFPENVQTYVRTMIDTRKIIGIISKPNSYLFANPEVEFVWLTGYTAIRKLAKESNIENTEIILSRTLREQIAILMQILNLNARECEQFAAYVKLAERTRVEFFESLKDTYQIAKISQIVALFDKGVVGDFEGKTLNDIEIDPETEMIELDKIDHETEMTKLYKIEKCDPSIGGGENKIARRSFKNSKRKCRREAWTDAQMKILKKHFVWYIRNKKEPGKTECTKFKEKYKKLFENKNWVKIKAQVYNEHRKQELSTLEIEYVIANDNERIPVVGGNTNVLSEETRPILNEGENREKVPFVNGNVDLDESISTDDNRSVREYVAVAVAAKEKEEASIETRDAITANECAPENEYPIVLVKKCNETVNNDIVINECVTFDEYLTEEKLKFSPAIKDASSVRECSSIDKLYSDEEDREAPAENRNTQVNKRIAASEYLTAEARKVPLKNEYYFVPDVESPTTETQTDPLANHDDTVVIDDASRVNSTPDKSDEYQKKKVKSGNQNNDVKLFRIADQHITVNKNTIWLKIETQLYNEDAERNESVAMKKHTSWIKIEALVSDEQLSSENRNIVANKTANWVKIDAQVFDQTKIPDVPVTSENQNNAAAQNTNWVKMKARVFDEPEPRIKMLSENRAGFVNNAVVTKDIDVRSVTDECEKRRISLETDECENRRIDRETDECENRRINRETDECENRRINRETDECENKLISLETEKKQNQDNNESYANYKNVLHNEFKKSVQKRRVQVRWTTEQIKKVRKYFAWYISEKKEPGKTECVKFKEKYPELFKNKDWVKIKARVFNEHRKQ